MSETLDQDGFIKSQPLKLSAGWTIDWFIFPEVDPNEDNLDLFDSSSLLSAHNENCNIVMDVCWSPEMDINGRFMIKVLPSYKTYLEGKGIWSIDTDWENPAIEFESKSRLETVDKIESIFSNPPLFKDLRFKTPIGSLKDPDETIRLELIKYGPIHEVAQKAIAVPNKELHLLIIDHNDVGPEVLQFMIDANGVHKGPRNKALSKLNSKAFKAKHDL